MYTTNHQSRITNHAGYEIRENTMFTNNEEMTTVGAQLAARILDVGSASADLGIGGLKSALQRGIGIALAALFLTAPGTALADDECGPQLLVATAETVTCDPNDSYPDGVTYTSDGDLTLEVAPNDPVNLNVNEAGVNVTAAGGDSVFWDSSAFTAGNITGTGIVLDYASTTGAIGILTGSDVLGTGDATHGIRAISTSGAIDITTNGRVIGDLFGIQALSDSGNIAITANDRVNGDESAIQVETGGDAVINVGAGGDLRNFSGSTEAVVDVTAAGGTILNNAGSLGGSRRIAIQAAGGALTLNNDGAIDGTLDFSGLNEGESYIFNNNAGATWRVFLNSSDGKGFPVVGDLGAGEINNAGTIELAGRDTFVSAPGTTFTGIGDASVLELQNVILDGRGQFDCTAPTLAACLNLSGGATAGQTGILIATAISNPPFFLDPIDVPVNPGIVLVDVGGGSSAAEHFVLDPDSFASVDRDPGVGQDIEQVPLYAEDPVYGAVLKTGGLFDYALLYNPENQQHVLTSVPQKEGVEYVSFVQQALSIWHTTADAVAGRQADLGHDGQRGGWLRLIGGQTERDAAPSVTTHGNTFNYDLGYSLFTGGLVGGYDLSAGDDHVVGLHLGLLSTRTTFDGSGSRDRSKGVTFGSYGGWRRGGLRVDATLNANMLQLDHSPDRDLEVSDTSIKSLGLRAEAGWRLPLAGEAFYVQPLATAAYVLSDISALELRDYDLRFRGDESARAALGLRLGGETDANGGKVGRLAYWLTARAWDEQEDGANVQFQTEGDPLVIEDDLSGSFEEVGFGVEVSNAKGDISAYLSGGATFGDDADSYNISLGARMRW